MYRGVEKEEDNDNMRNRLAMLAYVGITEFTNQYFSWKVRNNFSFQPQSLKTIFRFAACSLVFAPEKERSASETIVAIFSSSVKIQGDLSQYEYLL